MVRDRLTGGRAGIALPAGWEFISLEKTIHPMFLNYPVPKDSATAWRLPSEPTVRRPAPALRRTIPVPARALLVILALFTSMNAVFAMSGIDAARALGGMREGDRYNAIAAMARTGQIRSPVSAADGAAILQGTTQVSRSASIARLASLFKADLSGAEAAAILGAEATLSEGNRYNAITALARAERFGPSLAEDAALALQGTTQVSRAAAISQIAPYLRPAISGRAVATVLGSARLLDEGSRYNAITGLARSARAKQPLAPVDVVSILDGTTQVSRAAAISQLATWIAVGLSGDDAAAILGRSGELTEGNRYNAITALAQAGRFRGSLTGDEMAAILQGTTGQSRAAAIAQIASAAKQQSTLPAIATTASPLGGTPAASSTGVTTPTRIGGAAPLTAPVKNQPSASGSTTDQCDAPPVAIDKPSPTCRERWQTAIFRANLPKIFFNANEYIDRWQQASEAGGQLVDVLASVADLTMFTQSVMKLPDGAKKATLILFKGNSMLLMLGFETPEQTLGVQLAGEAVDTLRSGVETMVEHQLAGAPARVSPLALLPKIVKLANSLLSYANTVRYSRLRNTYTLALEHMRLLYRMGGDQTMFAHNLGLAATASTQERLDAVNKLTFGFSTQLTDAGGHNASLAAKLVDYWTVSISALAGMKAK